MAKLTPKLPAKLHTSLIVASPLLPTLDNVTQLGLVHCVTSHMVTKASITIIGIECSFKSVYATHFENVNEPYGLVSIEQYLHWQNVLQIWPPNHTYQ
jgi:hypothetical protein